MTHQLNILLLTLGALQGALLSGYLLRTQKRNLANIYFVLILVVLGLQLTFKVMSKVWLMENYRLPYFMSYHLPYLMGPLLFLYIRARASREFRKTDLLHFIPFLIMLAIVSRQYYYPYPLFRHWGMSPYGQATVQFILLMVYFFLSWRLMQQTNELKTLKSFVIGLTCSETIIIITLAVMYMHYGRFPDVRLLFFVLTLFTYWISYKQLEQPNLFIARVSPSTIQLQIQSHSKYNRSSLKPEEATRISTLLSEAMHQQKLFLDSELSIESLARQLGVSRHHISQVLNERFEQTYSDFINNWRLNEAKSRLQSAKYSHYTIAAIAMDSGFSSVSNFNDLFKRKFGQTPSQCKSEGLGMMTA